MTMFILSEVIEREISTPVSYKDFASALSELYVRMAQAFGYTESEINAMLKEIEEQEAYDCGINIDYEKGCATAWGENENRCNIDWDISPIDID